jgi:RNA polymerase sigma-70 factor (ECF subfamily)
MMGRPDGLPAPAVPLSQSPVVPYSGRMNETTEDTALMLRYRDGDVQAFEVLYWRHNAALYRYLLRLCMNRDAAEDIYQEVWKKLIASRGRYQATAKFNTFLYRVAHNTFIDHARRNKRYSSAEAYDPDINIHGADEPDIAAEKILLRRRLDQALARLPDEQRDAFLLHEEGGLGLDAIALVTGVTRETAKSRLRYANKKLKTALTEPVGPGPDSEQA